MKCTVCGNPADPCEYKKGELSSFYIHLRSNCKEYMVINQSVVKGTDFFVISGINMKSMFFLPIVLTYYFVF